MAAISSKTSFVAVVGCVVLSFATVLPAQVTTPNNTSPLPTQNGVGTTKNLTPEQLQSLMLMRALQSRGRRGVQTGVPQYMPYGTPGFAIPQMEMQTPMNDPSQFAPDNANDKRVAARKAQAEKKQAELDKAKDKKAKDKKVNAAKKAPPAKKPVDNKGAVEKKADSDAKAGDQTTK